MRGAGTALTLRSHCWWYHTPSPWRACPGDLSFTCFCCPLPTGQGPGCNHNYPRGREGTYLLGLYLWICSPAHPSPSYTHNATPYPVYPSDPKMRWWWQLAKINVVNESKVANVAEQNVVNHVNFLQNQQCSIHWVDLVDIPVMSCQYYCPRTHIMNHNYPTNHGFTYVVPTQ